MWLQIHSLPWLAVWPWGNYLTSLSLCFFTCKKRLIVETIPWENTCEHQQTSPTARVPWMWGVNLHIHKSAQSICLTSKRDAVNDSPSSSSWVAALARCCFSFGWWGGAEQGCCWSTVFHKEPNCSNFIGVTLWKVTTGAWRSSCCIPHWGFTAVPWPGSSSWHHSSWALSTIAKAWVCLDFMFTSSCLYPSP